MRRSVCYLPLRYDAVDFCQRKAKSQSLALTFSIFSTLPKRLSPSPVRMFLNASSTLVESKAEVSMNESVFFSEEQKQKRWFIFSCITEKENIYTVVTSFWTIEIHFYIHPARLFISKCVEDKCFLQDKNIWKTILSKSFRKNDLLHFWLVALSHYEQSRPKRRHMFSKGGSQITTCADVYECLPCFRTLGLLNVSTVCSVNKLVTKVLVIVSRSV